MAGLLLLSRQRYIRALHLQHMLSISFYVDFLYTIFCINIITKLKTSTGNRVVALASFDLNQEVPALIISRSNKGTSVLNHS